MAFLAARIVRLDEGFADVAYRLAGISLLLPSIEPSSRNLMPKRA
jgi:hypothetical protein